MIKNLEKKWVSLVNSNRFRNLAKQGLLASFFSSTLYQSANVYRRYATTYIKTKRSPGHFPDVGCYCVFIGQTKSGSSMVGGLLDAHQNMVVADEADALKYVSAGFERDQLFHLLVHASRREVMKGRVTARRLTPYSFLVPGQWQGRYTNLRTVGDSTAAKTTQRLAQTPGLIEHLETVMGGIHVKFIQVIRNPYDPISIMLVRGKRTFENAISHYFTDCETLAEIRAVLNPQDLYSIRYEDFVSSPRSQLSNLCDFLGVEATANYLEGCSKILKVFPERSRELVDWEENWIDVVQAKIDQYDFLRGYTYSN